MKTCHYSLNLKIHFETLRVFCTTLRINLNSRYIIIKNSRYKVLITIKRRKCDQELKFILFYFSTLIQFFEVNFLSIDNYVHYSEFVSLHPVTLIVINYLCRILWFLGIHCRIYFKQSSMKFISLSSVVMKIKFCWCYLIDTKHFDWWNTVQIGKFLIILKLIENWFLISFSTKNAVYNAYSFLCIVVGFQTTKTYSMILICTALKCNLHERFLQAQD